MSFRENRLPVRITNATDDLYVAVLSGYRKQTALLPPNRKSDELGDGFNSIDGLAVYRVNDSGIFQIVRSYDNRYNTANLKSSRVWKISNGFGRADGRLFHSGGRVVFDVRGISMQELPQGDANYFSILETNYDGLPASEFLAKVGAYAMA